LALKIEAITFTPHGAACQQKTPFGAFSLDTSAAQFYKRIPVVSAL
jgi:hypothetical protein